MSLPLSMNDRLTLGQKQRKQMARVEHATWRHTQRKRSPLALLKESMRGRVPSLVALKYERMTASPFGFFRGAVPVMAYGLMVLWSVFAQAYADQTERDWKELARFQKSSRKKPRVHIRRTKHLPRLVISGENGISADQ